MGNFKQPSNPFSKIPKSTPLKKPGDFIGPVPATNFSDLPQFRGGNFNQKERDAEVEAAIQAGFNDVSGIGNRGMSEVNIPKSFYTRNARDEQGSNTNVNPNITQGPGGENPYTLMTGTGSSPRYNYTAPRDPETGERTVRTLPNGNELFQNQNPDIQALENFMSKTGGSVEDYAKAMGLLSDGKGGFAMDPSNYNRRSGITTYVPAGMGSGNEVNLQSFYTASNPETGRFVGDDNGSNLAGPGNTTMGNEANPIFGFGHSAYNTNGNMGPGYDERRVLDEFLYQGGDLPGTFEQDLSANSNNRNNLYSDNYSFSGGYNNLGGGTPQLPQVGSSGGPRPPVNDGGLPYFGPRTTQYGNNIPGIGAQFQNISTRQYNPYAKTPQRTLNSLQKNKEINENLYKTARASDSLAQTIEDQNLARILQAYGKGQSIGFPRGNSRN